MKSLIGVDIGTQGVKAALYTAEGHRLAESFEPSQLHRPQPGAVEEDPEFHVASACRMVRRCIEQAGSCDVAGLAVTGQMAGVIGLGANGRAVTPYDSWLDTRCAAQIVHMLSEGGDAVLSLTGNAPSFNHGPKILWWKQERPQEEARITKFVQPGVYVAMRLCGLGSDDAFIDNSYLHFSGFADNRAQRWDSGLCARFGIEASKLPRIVQPTTNVGCMTEKMSAACGLPSDTPVIAGCGDSTASFLSCGATIPGICVDVAGTASVFAATTNTFAPDTHGRMLSAGRAATDGIWHSYAYINGGGMNLEWFRREFARENAGFDELDALAASKTLSDELPLFLPHLGGRVSPAAPGLRGAWAGLTWEHTRGELYRAMLESVALEYAIYKKAVLRLHPDASFTEMRITGGGDKSAVWNQIKADVLQMPVVQIANGGSAPMGAAMIAGMGVGLLPSLPEASAAWVELGQRFDPEPKHAAYYRSRIDRYDSLLQALSAWAPSPA